ncbi:hypothetical protein [Pseudomonas sp. KU43P]|uniref:hypothetical protein n=1 Tax=Pseudomonas sp. KU43P TaxID=2487887 RepID=UPI0012A79754|nr:hypothetical protein [Pseudomonas sp. KU43P]BBH46047.1 hypothetical protein KU43P_25240 [Pseudomonas sp. KU43P]
MQELKSIEERYSSITSRSQAVLNSYLASSLPIVRERVISKGALYNQRPFEIERAGFKKGRQLKKMPASVKNTHVYHLDKNGQIIFVEIFGQSENIVNKEFYFYHDNCVERVYFTSVEKLRNVSLSLLEKGVVKKDLNWGEYGCSISDYFYSGDRLEKIHVRQKEHIDAAFSEYEVSLEYDGEDLVKILNVFPNGYQEQRFP